MLNKDVFLMTKIPRKGEKDMTDQERERKIDDAKRRIIAALDGVDCWTADVALQRLRNELQEFAIVHGKEEAREE